jgi:hypothetical protein
MRISLIIGNRLGNKVDKIKLHSTSDGLSSFSEPSMDMLPEAMKIDRAVFILRSRSLGNGK